MADGTKIEWTDATWNPITGCSVVSPGCTNCYAMKLAGTRLKHIPSRAGLTRETKAGPVWNGEVRLNAEWLDQPLRWKAPRMIFVCAHGDLFAEGVPDEWIDRVFAVMALAPQHTFQVLTKRAERMRDYLRIRAGDWNIIWPDANPPGSLRISRHEQRVAMRGGGWPDAILRPTFPLSNVWLGVSAEDQKRADERVPLLLDTPAAVRWVSAEPLLGPIDFTRIEHDRDSGWEDAMNALRAYPLSEAQEDWGEDCDQTADRPRLDWIVAGGESGNDARPMHPDWVRSIRDQCAAADVPFLFKQWGAWAPVVAEAGEDGELDAVPALPGCSDPSVHRADQECRFWQADGLVHWPLLETLPAIGARLVGKKAAGRLLDGVTHDAFPSSDEVPFS